MFCLLCRLNDTFTKTDKEYSHVEQQTMRENDHSGHSADHDMHRSAILGFHSLDQQSCFSTKTKEKGYIPIGFNSWRIGSGH